MDLNNPRLRDFPKSKRCLVIYSRPRFGVTWQVKPNQASAHIPGTSPHPTPFPTVNRLALTLLLMNQIPARQINALAALASPPPSLLTANSHQLPRSLPAEGNPAGSRHSPSLASNQTQLGEERHGVGEGCLCQSAAVLWTRLSCFQPCRSLPSIKLTAREQAPSVLCSIHRHL